MRRVTLPTVLVLLLGVSGRIRPERLTHSAACPQRRGRRGAPREAQPGAHHLGGNRSEQEVAVTAETAGQVLAVTKRQDTAVRKGEVVVQLDSENLTRAVQEAQFALSSAQVSLNSASATTQSSRPSRARRTQRRSRLRSRAE